MLTDDEARHLMRRAAETIEVGPARPVEPVRRRRPVLVALAAAAAVAVAAGTTVALTRGDTGTATDRATDPAATPAPGQTADEEPPSPDPSPSPAVDPGTVPVVFGYDEATARRLLEEAGATSIVTASVDGCYQTGRALRTEPRAGEVLRPGNAVRLEVTYQRPGTRCLPDASVVDEVFWPLLDFAREGSSSRASFAPETTSAVDGEVLTVTDAGDRDAWPAGSAMDALAALPSLTERAPGELPLLFGTLPDDGSGKAGCRGASAGRDPGLPEGYAGRSNDAIWMRHQDAGELGPCVVVNVFHDDGQVDAVVVRHLTWQAPED